MTFFVSICLLLRVIVSCLVYDLVYSPTLVLVGSSGAEEATSNKIKENQGKLDGLRRRLDREQEMKEVATFRCKG